MAGPVTTAVSLLLLALFACCIMPTDSVVIPSPCCINFVSKRVPESRVVRYQMSDRNVCPKAGVIFTTKSGRKFCGDPKQPWVQRYVRNLDTKQKRPPPRRPRNGQQGPPTKTPW